MRYQDPQLAELLAAEYVLGTLQGSARQRFEGLLHAHPSLRCKVREWEVRLDRLAQAAPPVPPPARTWEALERRLFGVDPAVRVGWLDRLALWRALAAGCAMLAGVLAVLLMVLPVAREAPGYVVIIHDMASQQPVWMVSTSADMGNFYIKNMKPLDAPNDIRCLLWLHPQNSQQFYPLGVLPDRGDEMMLKVDKAMRPMLPGQLLVTIEAATDPMPTYPTHPPQFKGEWMPVKGI